MAHQAGAPADTLRDTLTRALSHQYDVLRLLGQGGMGAVYLAREKALDRLVAIKVLRPEATDPSSAERFRREARTAAGLSHANIVPLYTFGDALGTMYFVMGFVQGEPLSARLRRRGRMEPAQARELLIQLAGALHYAHGHGVVHRDIKPDNILIEDESERPLLTDFGVAKLAAKGQTLTELGTTLGTPLYMSPEQAAGERVLDGRSDLYSLGVVAYEMLAGRPPFQGESAREVMSQHIAKDPLPIKSLAPAVPDALAEVVSQLLAKDPARRFQDGRSLEQALHHSAGAEALLPRELEDLVEEIRPIPWMTGGCLYLSYGFAVFGNWVGVAASAAIGGLLALLPWAVRRGRKLERYSWSTILSGALRKPRRWAMWWPRRFRTETDLWDRLPDPVRRFRAGMTPALGGFLLMLPVFLWTGWGSPSEWWFKVGLPIAVFPAFAAVGVLVWRGYLLTRWGRRHGLSATEISKLSEADDAASLWRRPHIQQLLLPEPAARGQPRLPTPGSPAEQVEALIQLEREMEGPARALAAEALAAGREVLASIEALDRQIANLARDADAAEPARLEQKLAALADQPGADSEPRRRMRRLLEEQLELARDLTRNLTAAEEKRAHLVDVLKTLWLHLASLRAHQHEAAFDAREISGRIRAVTEDAKRYLAAAEEVNKLLESGSPP